MEDKQISKFLEFEIYDETEPTKEDFGISEKPAKKVGKKLAFVVCPLCSLSRKLNKTGAYYTGKRKRKKGTASEYRSLLYNPQKETAFNLYDLENSPFISLRVASGKGYGLPEVEIIKLKDIANLPKKDQKVLFELLEQIKEQCSKIIDYINLL